MNAKLWRLTLLVAVFLLGSAACEESRTDGTESSAPKTPDESAPPAASPAPHASSAPEASPAPGATSESGAGPDSSAATESEQRLQAVAAADGLGAPNSWLLESYGAPNKPQKAIESAKVTATFTPGGERSGTVQGNAGCNGYSGPFEREGSKLKIGAPIATRKFCNPPAVMQQEAAFLAALSSASSFEVEKDRLTILYGSGQQMHFTKQQVAEPKD